MPEILTESFCERCGTRYTFESAAPRKTRRLGQFKTLSKGMKNWVMSDDTSLDEAMAAARSDEERELTSQQLDAFHSTFNFCMNCRQYTCANCWNVAEGRCLTCAPNLGQEVLGTPFPESASFEPARIEAEAWPEVDLGALAAAGNGNGNGDGGHGADAWGDAADPGIEEIDPAARLAFLSGEAPAPSPTLPPSPSLPPEPVWPNAAGSETADLGATAGFEAIVADRAAAEPVGHGDVVDMVGVADMVEPATESVTEPLTEPAAADSAEQASPALPVAEPLPPTVEGRAVAGAHRTSDLLQRFRPGQSLDAELAAYEAEFERQETGAADVPATAEAIVAEAEGTLAEPVAAPAARAADTPTVDEPTVTEPGPAEPEPLAAAQPEPVAAAEPVLATPSPAPAVSDAVAADAPVEPEPVAVDAAAVEPEPVAAAAAAPEPGPAPLPEPEPIAASAEPEPAPAEPAPEPVRDDRIEQPTWRIYAPDPTGTGLPAAATPSAPPPAPAPANGSSTPQWPVNPDHAESPAMALLMNRGNGSADAGLWAASSREVLAQPEAGRPGAAPSGVQPCSNCGLSLSATARFCRRCGTRQG